MKRTPLVSVIIPCYNYGRYLTECLQSVADSTIDLTLIEVLVIDDASTDDSGHIADTFGRENPDLNIRLIQNDVNLGLVRSRNRGIHHARGEFVFFLDADNYIGPDCLKIHADTLINHPEAIGCYGVIQDFEDGTNKLLGLRSKEPFSYDHLLNGPYIDAMAMFRRRELMDFGMFDTQMPSMGWEDYELWLRMGMSQKMVCFIETGALSFYRKHLSNMGLKVKTDVYNQVVYYLKTKSPIRLPFDETDIIHSIGETKKPVAQLFYGNSKGVLTETQSQITSIDHHPLTFTIPRNNTFHKLRFDPLNDYVYMRLENIRFFENGNERKLKYILSSNAVLVENSTYLFDTEDSQIYIDFEGNTLDGIDQVQLWVEYMAIGAEALNMAVNFYKSRSDLLANKLEKSVLAEEQRIGQLAQLTQEKESLSIDNVLLTKEIEHLQQHAQALSFEVNYYKNWWKMKLKKIIHIITLPFRFLVNSNFTK